LESISQKRTLSQIIAVVENCRNRVHHPFIATATTKTRLGSSNSKNSPHQQLCCKYDFISVSANSEFNGSININKLGEEWEVPLMKL